MPETKVATVSKAEADRRLGISPRTVDRRIEAGQLRTVTAPLRGKPAKPGHACCWTRTRSKKPAEAPTQGAQLAEAQERIRSLEELVNVHETAQRQAADREAHLSRRCPASANGEGL